MRLRRWIAIGAATLVLSAATPSAHADGPVPGSKAWQSRDDQNQADAWGRVFGPGGQLKNPNYLGGLLSQVGPLTVADWAAQAKRLNRPSVTLGTIFPPADIGNPLRAGWSGRRGRSVPISFTNRYGALLQGTVYAPLDGARDPYSHRLLKGPFPGVVITTGSVQGTERMYTWLAQDLAERGYVVLTYDVQGQGRSETLPHLGTKADLPFCDFTAKPLPGEAGGCPGVPFQQAANFVYGTEDAIGFFQATPGRPWANRAKGSTHVDAYNPFWQLFDHSPDLRTVTKGRTNRLAVIGHSLGAAAVTYVQGVDRRVETVVALDKLWPNRAAPWYTEPSVPALALQSEYGFLTQVFTTRPDPAREKNTGFAAWAAAGVDSMLVVPRASTHLDYTDIPLVLPASRYGQDLSSAYTQAWLDKYLKHDPAADRVLLGRTLHYLEPTAVGVWSPVTLHPETSLSFYFCSAYRLHRADGTLADNPDIAGVGC